MRKTLLSLIALESLTLGSAGCTPEGDALRNRTTYAAAEGFGDAVGTLAGHALFGRNKQQPQQVVIINQKQEQPPKNQKPQEDVWKAFEKGILPEYNIDGVKKTLKVTDRRGVILALTFGRQFDRDGDGNYTVDETEIKRNFTEGEEINFFSYMRYGCHRGPLVTGAVKATIKFELYNKEGKQLHQEERVESFNGSNSYHKDIRFNLISKISKHIQLSPGEYSAVIRITEPRYKEMYELKTPFKVHPKGFLESQTRDKTKKEKEE